MLLMCKDVPVYDIETEKVLNEKLLPGFMMQQGANSHTFAQWMKLRYSSEISPYYQPFWDGSDIFSGQAAPTLYVEGVEAGQKIVQIRRYRSGIGMYPIVRSMRHSGGK